MNKLYIYDSVKKEEVEFNPIVEGKVKIYVCGPTVYDDSHLGHARSAIAFDLLHRVLKTDGYEVTMTKISLILMIKSSKKCMIQIEL